MKRKKSSEPSNTESESSDIESEDQTMQVQQPCGAWAFILGPSFNAFCPLDKEHEGEHRVEIAIYSEPKSHFVIQWILD